MAIFRKKNSSSRRRAWISAGRNYKLCVCDGLYMSSKKWTRILNLSSRLKRRRILLPRCWYMLRSLQIEFCVLCSSLPPANRRVLCTLPYAPVSSLERGREKERPCFLFNIFYFSNLFHFVCILSIHCFRFSRPPIDSGSCTLMTYFIHAI